ncbi:MAG: type II toxin-antitoxin system VapB family antitoxin [Balneolaceae bacterium]|nr:MAG: type II toxin-antitoxin system VapB family antitoxin [Balneolaceae bacterium]
MKTTIDIPDSELRDAIRFTGAKTKREAVVTAIREFNRRNRAVEAVKMFGTFKSVAANSEIEGWGTKQI